MSSSHPPFYTFLREERQFCAALAHLLMQEGSNLLAFLELLEERPEIKTKFTREHLEDAEIYLEFAYLRDIWDGFGAAAGRTRAEANSLKREFIKTTFERLGLTDALGIDLDAPVQQFNSQFIREALVIAKDIASPHHWSVAQLSRLCPEDPAAFLTLCKFQWSFNIKPDIVIIIPGSGPICIEAKLGSAEAVYPTKASELALFDTRFRKAARRVRQCDLQAFMFSLLPGGDAQQVLVAREPLEGKQDAGDTSQPPVVTWLEVHSRMDDTGSIPFVRRLFNENSTIRKGMPQPEDVALVVSPGSAVDEVDEFDTDRAPTTVGGDPEDDALLRTDGLVDGRPFRAEIWQSDDAYFVTIIFPAIEGDQEDAVRSHFLPLLVEFHDNDYSWRAGIERQGPSDWSLQTVVCDKERQYVNRLPLPGIASLTIKYDDDQEWELQPKDSAPANGPAHAS